MTTPHAPRGRKVVAIVLVLVGLFVLYWLVQWAKERWIDPDRLLLGVHALGEHEALALYRYDGDGTLTFHLARIDLRDDDLRWERDVGVVEAAVPGQGITVGGGSAVLVSWGDTGHALTALELDTGQTRWAKGLDLGEELVKVSGNERFVFLDSYEEGVLVFDRDTGQQRLGHDHHGFMLAFTDDWLELRGDELTYLDLHSLETTRVEGARGAQCRVGTTVYGVGRGDEGLVGRDLVGERARTLVGAELEVLGHPLSRHSPDACGWFRTDDGKLRLVLVSMADDEVGIFAVDVDESNPESTGAVAWTIGLDKHSVDTGEVSYDVQNRLDLPWHGPMPRFAPLELRTHLESGVTQHVALVDLQAGAVVSEGAPFESSFHAFVDGTTVFMRVAEYFPDQAESGHLIALDGASGAVQGSIAQIAIGAGPWSISGDAVWTWANATFSRAGDMAIAAHDRQLGLRAARAPGRVPAVDQGAAKELLGR